ncbi:lysylphosphatidylglycerol synthase transmembrane domain-containing protein [Psychroflexus tropicus]|uniref:lysylphosphatidylglycerol synthase transmembrane domain-containing protein n=1 Tax=Psychroflexus tropicus TaxID=197345 RepID=UPI00039B33F4|nr:lysylphosphatidylglycerol synthase transmembrane domain-containing protein [Psychroflexus tropicus]
MNKSLKKWIRLLGPMGLGIFFIWFSLSKFSSEELQQLWFNIKNVDLVWVIISFAMGIASHLSRAYRWRFLLEPVGIFPKFYNGFFSLMLGYLANLGIPRSGEVLRGATLASYEDVKFENTFGTIITERLVDLSMLLIVLGLASISQSDKIFDFLKDQDINPFFGGLIILCLILLLIIGFRIVRRSQLPFFMKIKNFMEELFKGMKSVFTMKKKIYFLLHSLLIWGLYIGMFYILKFAFPDTHTLGFEAMIVAFIFGAFAMSVTNGGIGLYPVAIGLAFNAFGVSSSTGEAFGWVMWGTQTGLVIILGGLSFLVLPLLNKR